MLSARCQMQDTEFNIYFILLKGFPGVWTCNMQRRVKRSTKLKGKKALQTATTCKLQAEKENATRMISDGVSFPIGLTFSSLRNASGTTCLMMSHAAYVEQRHRSSDHAWSIDRFILWGEGGRYRKLQAPWTLDILGSHWRGIEQYTRFSWTLVWKLVSASWKLSLLYPSKTWQMYFSPNMATESRRFQLTVANIVEQGRRLSHMRQLFCGLLLLNMKSIRGRCGRQK
jgi:hypothetical protein